MLKEKKAFNCSYLDKISLSGLFLLSKIPPEQKALANNFVIIRKIFSYTVVQPKVTNMEYQKLAKYGYLPLESTDADKMYHELMKLIDLANSKNKDTETLANNIFEIRVKELKYLIANTSKNSLKEFLDGYTVLIKYLEFIAG